MQNHSTYSSSISFPTQRKNNWSCLSSSWRWTLLLVELFFGCFSLCLLARAFCRFFSAKTLFCLWLLFLSYLHCTSSQKQGCYREERVPQSRKCHSPGHLGGALIRGRLKTTPKRGWHFPPIRGLSFGTDFSFSSVPRICSGVQSPISPVCSYLWVYLLSTGRVWLQSLASLLLFPIPWWLFLRGPYQSRLLKS